MSSKPGKQRTVTRRVFAKWLAAVSGSVVMLKSRSASASVNTSAIQSALTARGLGVYPLPAYVPDQFRLLRLDFERPDGFHGAKGELALWFVNDRSRLGLNNPLSIFIAPGAPTQFGLTEAMVPEHLWLSRANGERLPAEYYSGVWARTPIRQPPQVVYMDQSNVHALVTTVNGHRIGIRGARAVNVTLEDLVRIAVSFS